MRKRRSARHERRHAMSYKPSQTIVSTPLPKGKGGTTTRLVLGVLCGRTNSMKGYCAVSVERIAWECQRSERMVRYALADLVAWGAISRQRGGQHNVDRYTVNVAWLENQHRSSEASFKIVREARRSAERPDDGAPDRQSIAPLNGATGATHCIPGGQPIAPKQSHEQGARARKGTGEAPTSSPGPPVGSARARTPPATRHTPYIPRNKQAHPREPASLRSGDGARAVARRATPAPARAQTFDIETWSPTPEQLLHLQSVRPDLDPEVIEEQLVAFRVWSRGKGLTFRDDVECVRRLSGFLRQAYAPRRVARPKGSAGAERAAPTKLNGKDRGASPPRKSPAPRRALPLRTVPLHELRSLAEQAGGYLVKCMDNDPERVVLIHPSNITAATECDLEGAYEQSSWATASALRRQINKRAKSEAAAAQPISKRLLHELEKLAERCGRRVEVLGPVHVMVWKGDIIEVNGKPLAAASHLRRLVIEHKRRPSERGVNK